MFTILYFLLLKYTKLSHYNLLNFLGGYFKLGMSSLSPWDSTCKSAVIDLLGGYIHAFSIMYILVSLNKLIYSSLFWGIRLFLLFDILVVSVTFALVIFILPMYKLYKEAYKFDSSEKN